MLEFLNDHFCSPIQPFKRRFFSKKTLLRKVSGGLNLRPTLSAKNKFSLEPKQKFSYQLNDTKRISKNHFTKTD